MPDYRWNVNRPWADPSRIHSNLRRYQLEPEEEKFYQTGYKEVEEIIEKLGKRASRPRR